jgi:protein phosphatase 1L
VDIAVGISEDIGKRDGMEDDYAVYDRPEIPLFSAEVYDGHLGREVARVASEMLTPHFLDQWRTERDKPLRDRLDDINILREAYAAVDKYVVATGIRGGAAAATIHIMKGKFMAANAGDSRVVIGAQSGAKTLTLDHKPDVPEERSRIESLGGMITRQGTPRVMGFLAMSRALGDTELKPFVSPEPRIVSGLLGRENDYAVLCCDGIWDVLSTETVIDIARRAGEAQKGAEAIKDRARKEGSADNITVLVLDLRAYTGVLARAAMKTISIVDFALPREQG